MRALFTGVLVLILFTLLMGNASAADSCNKGSFDDKVDADTFWWAVIMDCSEIEHGLAVNTYLQKFDWNS